MLTTILYIILAILALTTLYVVIRTIIFDEHRTMPLSTCFAEWQGIEDNCFSIPVVLGREGIIRHLHLQLNQRAQAELRHTASIIKNHLKQLLPEYV